MLMILPSSVGGELVATDYSADVEPVEFYNANGSSVNSAHADWGQAGTLLGRVANASHDPMENWMGLADLPNPREISNIVCAQPGVINDERGLSDFNWLWGQFITHEIDFTLTQNGRVGENGGAGVPGTSTNDLRWHRSHVDSIEVAAGPVTRGDPRDGCHHRRVAQGTRVPESLGNID